MGSCLRGEQINALAVTIAGDVVCNGCVGINGDGTNDIKFGSETNVKITSSAVTNSKISSNAVTSSKIAAGGVANSDIASNSVTGDKIADGTIKYSDVSSAFVAVEHRDDCNCRGTGWDPDGTSPTGYLYDARITANAVASVTLSDATYSSLVCWTQVFNGRATVQCNTNIPIGVGIAIFTNPAYSSKAAVIAEPTPRGVSMFGSPTDKSIKTMPPWSKLVKRTDSHVACKGCGSVLFHFILS